jgi:hypothetical protein
MKRFVTKKVIAAELKISRTTLDRYLEMDGAPKEKPAGWDFAAVSKFISEKSKTTATSSKSNPQMAELKLRELQLRCDRLAHKLETERGLHIAKASIGPSLRNAHDHWRAEFQKAEQELPARLVNRTENEIAKELRQRHDKIFAYLEANTRQWMHAPQKSTTSQTS